MNWINVKFPHHVRNPWILGREGGVTGLRGVLTLERRGALGLDRGQGGVIPALVPTRSLGEAHHHLFWGVPSPQRRRERPSLRLSCSVEEPRPEPRLCLSVSSFLAPVVPLTPQPLCGPRPGPRG